MEFFNTLAQYIQGHIDYAAVISAIVAFYAKDIWAALNNKVPEYLIYKLNDMLDFLLQSGDDADDRLILDMCAALIAWAERKYPGEGRGSEKYAAVAQKFVLFLKPRLPFYLRPFISVDNDKLKLFIETVFSKVKDFLKTKIAEETKPEPKA